MAGPSNFSTKVLAGYAAVLVLLAGGMSTTILRLSRTARSLMDSIRTEEKEITIVERLRWRGELIVSNGRGYLLAGDPVLLARLRDFEQAFTEDVEELKGLPTSAAGKVVVAEVERTAAAYTSVLRELVEVRQRLGADPPLVQRFETELLPLRERFGRSLDRLVEHKQSAIAGFYERAGRDQLKLNAQMFALLGVLVLAGVGIAWRFSRLLTRSFEKERAALEISRRAVAARDELMGIVAHDLRNPLGAITMKAALLGRSAESSQARQHAEAIGSMATRMEFLIKSMLDVATIEAGHFTVYPAPCDPSELVETTVEMFENLAAAKQIRIERRVPETLLAVRADRERILQVLSNLVGNALKFTPEGGVIRISVGENAGEACFSVSDTGPGIAPEHLPHLFERFWKKETEAKKGTGLGLFISKGIIEAHGGQIRTESRLGHGASFFFTLPFWIEMTTPTRLEAAPPHAEQ